MTEADKGSKSDQLQDQDLAIGRVIRLEDDLAEVIPREDLLITKAMVEEYMAFLDANFSIPYRVMVNRKHSYTYEFDAQELVNDMANVKATAVVIYNKAAQLATESMAMFPRDSEWNMQTFSDREEALAWIAQFKPAEPNSP